MNQSALRQEMLRRVAERRRLRIENPESESEAAEEGRFRLPAQPLGVADTEELRRILALPIRELPPDEDPSVVELCELVTEAYRAPTGEHTVWPGQALVLQELADERGALAVLPVGEGKTIVTRLAPLVIEAKRPMLLVPGGLVDKTHFDFEKLDPHWKKHDGLEVFSINKLALKGYANYLEGKKPDLVIVDEVHNLKNPESAATRRLGRYMEENLDTVFLGLSGTVTSRSLLDFHHLLHWALGEDRMPLPDPVDEVEAWALALDEKVKDANKFRLRPGPLRLFVEGTPDKVTREQARVGFQRRLRGTAGVIVREGKGCGASMRLETWEPELPAEIEEDLDRLSSEWTLPDGTLLLRPVDLWRHSAEMAQGFCYTLRHPAPEWWMRARRAWGWFVRERIAERSYDTEAQVKEAVEMGHLPDGGRLSRWESARPGFEPERITMWRSTAVLEQLRDRVENKPPTIVWASHQASGEKAAEILGVPYFGQKGLGRGCGFDGVYIEELEGSQTIVASISANGTGRNLQAWARSEFLAFPSTGHEAEQVLGRTHRRGQEADTVHYGVMLAHKVLRQCFEQAQRDALYQQEITGLKQKLLLADRV